MQMGAEASTASSERKKCKDGNLRFFVIIFFSIGGKLIPKRASQN